MYIKNASDHSIKIPQAANNGQNPPVFQNTLVFGKDVNGRPVIIPGASADFFQSQAAINADMAEFQQRIGTHDWYYRLHGNLDIFSQGYYNEQAIEAIVRRRGGVFATIWDTERRRHLATV